MTETISATYTGITEQAVSPWVVLEQEAFGEEAQVANAADIVAMYNMAVTGLTAHAYTPERCPATILDGVVTAAFYLYAFPSALDLQYQLEVSNGELSEAELVRVAKEQTVVVGMSDELDLGYLVEDIEIIKTSGFYGEDGSLIDHPQMVATESGLKFSARCFAVLRLRFNAVGFRYKISISVTKEEGYSITNLQSTAQATWLEGDEIQSVSLDLDIPECIESLLAYCPETGDLPGVFSVTKAQIYYDDCTGNILLIIPPRYTYEA